MQYVFIFFVTSYAFTFTHNSRNFHFYSHIHFHFHMLKVEIVFGGFLRQKLMYSLWRVVWDKKFVHTFSVSICWWSFACRLREHVLTKKYKKILRKFNLNYIEIKKYILPFQFVDGFCFLTDPLSSSLSLSPMNCLKYTIFLQNYDKPYIYIHQGCAKIELCQ